MNRCAFPLALTCFCASTALSQVSPNLPHVYAAADVHHADHIDEPELPVGWQWEMPVTRLNEGWKRSAMTRFVDGGVLSCFQPQDGNIIVQHTRTKDVALRGARAPQFAIYLLHEDGTQCSGGGRSGMSRGDVSVDTHHFQPAPGDHGPVTYIGLAVLTFEGRTKASAAALERAGELGASVLPLPLVDEAYEYDLPVISGASVGSSSLRGKVVLIDCWATWCGPCMAKMPELRDVYAKYKDRGLVVIGINFDDELDVAKDAIAANELTWPQVHAPSAVKGHDELWEQATGITTLPRLFLIDRDGVLVDDFYPNKLEQRIKALIDEQE